MQPALPRAVAAVLLMASAAPALANDPPVPAGLDPGGEAIALITDGVDYTDTVIAGRLARDGEGEPITLDLVDGDVRPYAAPGHGRGTRLAKIALAAYPSSRLIIVRAAPTDPASLARAVIFASRTPARVVALSFWGQDPDIWKPFAEAVRMASQVAFVLPGGTPAVRTKGDVFPAAFNLPNAIVAADLKVSDLQEGSKLAVDAWLGTKVDQDYLAPLDAAVPDRKVRSAGPDIEDAVDGAAFIAAVAACFKTPGLTGADIKKQLLERAPFSGQGRQFFDLSFTCNQLRHPHQKM